jgi:hypothetical protein
MNRTWLITLLVFFALGGYLAGIRTTPAEAQGTARCKIVVPESWGEYVGASDSFGLTFKDSAGTLRFVRQLPCGLEGTPAAALEVQRN